MFLALFALLYWTYRNRIRLGGGRGYAIDPVCGMQVESARAPATVDRAGVSRFFCSDRCRARFEADPDHYEQHPASHAAS